MIYQVSIGHIVSRQTVVALRTVYYLLQLELWQQAIILCVNNCSAVHECFGERFVCTGAWGGRKTGRCLTHRWKAFRRWWHYHYLVVSQDLKPN